MVIRPRPPYDSPDDPRPERAFELPNLLPGEFEKLIDQILHNPNLGAGIDVSGVSGSGKSNFAEWLALRSIQQGVPIIHIDPHGQSARKLWQMCLRLPERLRKKVIYWRVSDPQQVAGINPLAHDPEEVQLSDYERLSRGRIQVELTANIILAAMGEAGVGFAFRPVMRKWITRWLWLLWNAGLTLADASMLIDPHHPVYNMLIQLAPDEMARLQLEALPGMKVHELEAEIGSARNRVATILEHIAAETLLSRRQDTIDFRWMYQNDVSLIVDLDKGLILSDEVQRLICNVVLNQYLAVVLSTPEHERRRRLCQIDELPVFTEACGPLLEKMATEIRKYQTSFVFLHQGASRFPNRTDNEFLRTILDMCRVKLFFRHKIDAEFFGKIISLAAHSGPKVKHVLKTPQQFTVGNEIIELIDRSEGEQEMEGHTSTDGTAESNTLTSTLSEAVDATDRRTRSNADGSTSSATHTDARQHTQTRTRGKTYKQTVLPKLKIRNVVSSVQHYATEEIDRGAAAFLAERDTGEAAVMIDGQGVFQTKVPLASLPYSHAPQFAARKLRVWKEQIHARPEFVSPQQIREERQQFLEVLVEELQTLSYRRSAGVLDVTQKPWQPPSAAKLDHEPVEPPPPSDEEEGDAPWSI
ncbi:MAG: hypothetical protein KDA93_09625 [Planctomycetaceae bacterium]|nr:hypothetical protein [Planctomycetaceae bacterium]